ncbi:GNAT family N-acetyltransferase [Mucilaginibacter sp. UR6-1]|uniref:GNAT family N-acetyltransferase n=1 Tax=Mucilaginibacter sp. UR6-1 TaxID=1435643 RepID=UPI001E4BE56B|nr:GNAT family N-acetyltransferase [Mucilaginibacter sp. UR6-1]MCC8409720.1 GNAT family N-acetyltransferase [Mucilaginibacter sp. UR6-1]
MIRFIQVEDLLAVRNQVLREGRLQPHECIFPTDKIDGAFHLGYYVDDELACLASFHPQSYGEFTGKGYQLRGMATTENHRGKGLGNQLLNFAIVYLRGQQANYLWCNARKKAMNFYFNVGFEVISPEFDVPRIGPHHVMYLRVR